jgi:hypothetical protein
MRHCSLPSPPAAVLEVDKHNVVQLGPGAVNCPLYSAADLLGVARQELMRAQLGTWLEVRQGATTRQVERAVFSCSLAYLPVSVHISERALCLASVASHRDRQSGSATRCLGAMQHATRHDHRGMSQ